MELPEFCDFEALFVLLCYFLGQYNYSFLWILLVLSGMLYRIFRRKRRNLELSKLRITADKEKEVVFNLFSDLPTWINFPDTERVEWLNKIIAQLWPYIAEYCLVYFQEYIIPGIRSQLPGGYRLLKFTKLSIGDIPLRVTGIKVYGDNVGKDRVILDMDVTYAGDAEFAVRFAGFRGGVNQIQLSGKLRAVMKCLLPYPPIVGAIAMSFVELPIIDFNLTGLGQVAELPGLICVARSIVNAQIVALCVLPNEIIIPFVPGVDLTTAFLPQVDGVIRVKIIEARNLENQDHAFLGQGVSDPYVELQVGSQLFKTRTVKDNLNPIWNEYFEAVVDAAEAQNLRFELFDEDIGSKDDELGRLTVPISEIKKAGRIDKWYCLEACKHGDLHFKASWYGVSKNVEDFESIDEDLDWLQADKTMHPALLMVFVENASNLLCPKASVNPSSYAELTVGLTKHITAVKPLTSNPHYQYKCTFFIKNPKVQKFLIEIIDDVTKRSLGSLTIELGSMMDEPDLEIHHRTFPLSHGGQQSTIVLSLFIRALKAPESFQPTTPTFHVPDKGNISPPSSDGLSRESSVEKEISINGRNYSNLALPSETVSDSEGIVHLRQRRSFKQKLFSLKHSKRLSRSFDTSFGKLLIDLTYNRQECLLLLTVHRALGLVAIDQAGLADPYLTVQLISLVTSQPEQKKRTPVFRHTLEPIFNRKFYFTVYSCDLNNYKLQVKVKDGTNYGIFTKNATLGMVEIRLENVDMSKGLTNFWLVLNQTGK